MKESHFFLQSLKEKSLKLFFLKYKEISILKERNKIQILNVKVFLTVSANQPQRKIC